jgi:exopolysaccharide biosynthesis polyprenyl glycosylphosphotransferase
LVIKGGKVLETSKQEMNIEILDKCVYDKATSYYLVKRTIDLLGAVCGIVIFSPLFIFLAIAIKLESKGPVFFSQQRVGKDGKLFYMYKFRSMVVNAEEQLKYLKNKNEMSGPMFKMKDDPRITRIGKFIRKTSIDELPQLLNILKGEMSFVGPRPNLPAEVAQFNRYQEQKLLVKPGLTCYWQVMGRNKIGFEEWMRLDVKYVVERSTWVDIKLLFKTIRVLFGDGNAM